MGAGDGEASASKVKGSGGGVERTSLDGVRDKNVMQLKKLNTALFPVRYNDKYYQDAIASKDFSKLGAHPTPTLLSLFLSSLFSMILYPRRRSNQAHRDRLLTCPADSYSWDARLTSWICGQSRKDEFLGRNLGALGFRRM
jgi:hypothetical protein